MISGRPWYVRDRLRVECGSGSDPVQRRLRCDLCFPAWSPRMGRHTEVLAFQPSDEPRRRGEFRWPHADGQLGSRHSVGVECGRSRSRGALARCALTDDPKRYLAFSEIRYIENQKAVTETVRSPPQHRVGTHSGVPTTMSRYIGQELTSQVRLDFVRAAELSAPFTPLITTLNSAVSADRKRWRRCSGRRHRRLYWPRLLIK